jgi:hypothetical protein
MENGDGNVKDMLGSYEVPGWRVEVREQAFLLDFISPVYIHIQKQS